MLGKKVGASVLAVAATLVLAGSSSASAATQVGEVFAPLIGDCGAGYTFLQTTSPDDRYAMPSGGVVTSWTFRADGSPPTLGFKVARPLGGDSYRTVGESPVESPSANSTTSYDARIPVLAGDVIGFFIATAGNCSDVTAGYAEHYFFGDSVVGDDTVFVTESGHHLGVAATLEPDADNDGFGDETQDGCLDSSARHDDCVVPETTITKGAPNKTDKTKVKFKFTSDEPGATFECKLDKKAFKPCTSPKQVKRLKDGKHKFQVIAADAAGNVDPSAAKDKFKVVD